MELVLGPRARTDRTRNTRVAVPRLPAPGDGRPGEGQRLTPDAPHNGGRPPPPGTAPHHPRGTQPPQGMQAKGTVLGPHRPHTRANSTRVADPNSPPSGRAVGAGMGGRAQHTVPLATCRGGGGGPSPEGVACQRCKRRLVSGAVPPPAAVLWSGQPGFRDPCVPGAVGAGVGTQRPHSVRPCGPALLAGGCGRASPGGMPSTIVRGV